MKTTYKLLHPELTAILAMFEAKQNPRELWEGVCRRVGADVLTIEGAKTNDPHDFLAEPLKTAIAAPESAIPDIREGWTSASNAEADSLCPGRHLAQKGLPDEPKGEWAETGTRIHKALAGEISPSTLTLEERETFDACREIERAVSRQFFQMDLEYPPSKVMRHERLWVGQNPKHSGEADVIYRAGTRALILDYKVLSGDVAASSRNLQLRDLACLAYANIPLLTEIGTAIVQPMVTHKPDICLYTKEDLDRASTELVQRISASNDPKSARVAGEAQCKWCKARKVCLEFNRWQGAQLPAEQSVFQVAMANWTPEQRSLAASIIPIATKRLDEIKDYLKGLLVADPAAIPGWHLKDGATRTEIVDAQKCFDRFAEKGGKLPAFLSFITVRKGKLEEGMHEITGAKGKALKAEMTALLDGITETKQNAPSLEKVGEA